MRIALIGYGKMGHEIESVALQRGHQIAQIFDHYNISQLNEQGLNSIDVAIEFSTPETAFGNVMTCLRANKPVVCGTTGWLDKLEEAKNYANNQGGTLFYASNFSLGVNVFFRINRVFARYMNALNSYKPFITEIHHTQKKDAPSGTAITLAGIIEQELSTVDGWTLFPHMQAGKIPIEAIREGSVPGTHTVSFNSDEDEIVLTHKAKSRKGFALGAIIAAEYALGKKGFLTMDNLLKLD